MVDPEELAGQEVRIYLDHAHEMLEVAELNLGEGYYGTVVNRAYYAIFYAATALLLTQGLARAKHSGVLSAFREHFVKSGDFDPEYSRIYGRVVDDRNVADYEVVLDVDAEVAERDLGYARRFVEGVQQHLRQQGWL